MVEQGGEKLRVREKNCGARDAGGGMVTGEDRYPMVHGSAMTK